MKNIVSKFYVVAAFICSTAIVFAQEGPGDTADQGELEGADNQAPIGDYAWVLLLLGLVYVFYKLKSLSKQSNSEY